MSDSERYDVVVIGVGGIGSATVYDLARRGHDVLGLERFDVPHARGSSHGSTRIVRRAQHEGAAYVPLADRAIELWDRLERETGRELRYETGSVHAGPAGCDLVADAAAACDAHDVPYERLSGGAVSERFPGYDLPDDYDALYQPQGGFVACERGVSAHVAAAHAEGATVRARERVTGWSETTEGVRVRTEKGRYEAAHLVVTAGAWAAEFVPELDDVLRPVRSLMAWLQPETPRHFSPDAFPVFCLDGGDESGYGFPVFDVPGFKFGRELDPLPTADPEATADPSAAEEELLRRFAERFFPRGAGPTLSVRTCLQTLSADGHFVLGRAPGHDAVTVGAGFSGHGYKFAPVVGEVLSELATDGETRHDLGPHRVDRLDV